MLIGVDLMDVCLLLDNLFTFGKCCLSLNELQMPNTTSKFSDIIFRIIYFTEKNVSTRY